VFTPDNSIRKNGGRRGIRTLGRLLTYARVPGVCLKPLGHPSAEKYATPLELGCWGAAGVNYTSVLLISSTCSGCFAVAICFAMNKKTKNNGGSAAQSMMQLERLTRLVRSASHFQGLYPVQWEALRYLSRANSFSNSPHAMARYLGSTKGTISQTVAVLIKKGLVETGKRNGDARSISLRLTSAALALLAEDPLLHVAQTIGKLGDKTGKRFSKGLTEVLELEVLRQNEPSFGTCENCRHLDGKGAGGLWFCKNFQTYIELNDFNSICVEHASSD
jgi:DNA-binding MarR family transcriptional regulator